MGGKTFEEYQRDKREREWNDKVQNQKKDMGNAERVKRATEWKNIGNDKFKAGNVHEACDYYREAIIYVEDLVDARRKERNDLLMPLYCNLTQVYLKLGEFKSAEDVAGKAIAMAEIPRNAIGTAMRAKAHFRRGLARKALENWDASRDDLEIARQLQPGSEEIAQAFAAVRAELAVQAKKAREAMGGFLKREASEREKQEEKKKAQVEARRRAEEKRKERRAKAEQRQQMQEAFGKLSKGKMLYEQREKEMEPVREKEKEKKQTLVLEQDLLNIIDSSKGLPKTENLDDFMKKKEETAKGQCAELDQKKKILDKQKKEEQWDKDDVWKDQRDEHRARLEAGRASGELPSGPNSFWEAKEVCRWCEQRLRDLLVCVKVENSEVEPELVAKVIGGDKDKCDGYILKGVVTDVLKLEGDAAVMRLNPHKPPLHYYDYFLKLDWEVAICKQGEISYRTAEDLIKVAADDHDMKAPPSILQNRVLAGTFKIKEFSSEEELSLPDAGWQLATKVKQPCQHGEHLTALAEDLQDRLSSLVAKRLVQWANEYREHWKC